MWGHEGGFAVMLVAREGAGEAEDAVLLAGGMLLERVEWDEGALNGTARATVLVVEARGVGDDMLATLLPVINGIARERASPVVVALDNGQIDVVAAALLGPGVHLLVEPTMAMRVATLVVVGGAGDAGGGVREDDGARARRLESEIARIAELLMRLSGREGEGEPSVADRRRSYGAQGGGETPIDPAVPRGAIRARRMRDQFFGPGLFEDPAWDMLLDLFAAELEGCRCRCPRSASRRRWRRRPPCAGSGG